MKLGLGQMHEATDEGLKFARQLGVSHIIIHTPPLRGDGYWEFLDLLQLKNHIESYGLELAAIENLPRDHYDKLLLGAPGRDQQLDKVARTIRNMGAAGIRILGYHWMALGVWRTGTSHRGRGGSRATSFDYGQVMDAPLTALGEIGEEQLWESYAYFLERIIPIAEEAGVKLALHPDDPPVPSLAGTARIFRSVEAFKRMIEMVPSEYNAIEFCQGTFSEMGGDVLDAIRYFGARGKIQYVHFRNVRGTVPKFEETFVDEGDVDMFEAIRAYREVGFDGVLIPDHTPRIEGDSPWSHRGRAYAIGYMRALLERAEALS